MEEGCRGQPRLFLGLLPVMSSAAVPALLVPFVLFLLDSDLLEPVSLDPTALVVLLELVAYLGREPVQEVEQGARVAAHQSAGEGEGLVADFGEGAGCNALR